MVQPTRFWPACVDCDAIKCPTSCWSLAWAHTQGPMSKSWFVLKRARKVQADFSQDLLKIRHGAANTVLASMQLSVHAQAHTSLPISTLVSYSFVRRYARARSCTRSLMILHALAAPPPHSCTEANAYILKLTRHAHAVIPILFYTLSLRLLHTLALKRRRTYSSSHVMLTL